MRSSSLRVLVVDDDSLMRSIVQSWLEQLGFRQIYTAPDPTEALPIGRTERVDLIISDREMPNMNGFEFVQAVRRDALLAHSGFVMISGSKDTGAEERAIALGVNAYIAKPFSARVLRERLAVVLRETIGSEITFE
jgi:two-component system, chemotaxis family, chemotaxis protein CheY